MKITTIEKVAIAGLLVSVSVLIISVSIVISYLNGGTVQDDITQAGIEIKQIVTDIKEAE